MTNRSKRSASPFQVHERRRALRAYRTLPIDVQHALNEFVIVSARATEEGRKRNTDGTVSISRNIVSFVARQSQRQQRKAGA